MLHPSKPSGLINKKIDIDKFNNTSNTNNYIIHNLSKISQNKKNNNNLLSKIKEKVTKENIFPKNIKLNNKNSLQNNNNETNKSQSVHSSLKSSSNSNEEANIANNKIEDNSDKKESNEDEDDILSEQKE